MTIVSEGILGMPYEIAMSNEMSRKQFFNAVQELIKTERQQAQEIQSLKSKVQYWKGRVER